MFNNLYHSVIFFAILMCGRVTFAADLGVGIFSGKKESFYSHQNEKLAGAAFFIRGENYFISNNSVEFREPIGGAVSFLGIENNGLDRPQSENYYARGALITGYSGGQLDITERATAYLKINSSISSDRSLGIKTGVNYLLRTERPKIEYQIDYNHLGKKTSLKYFCAENYDKNCGKNLFIISNNFNISYPVSKNLAIGASLFFSSLIGATADTVVKNRSTNGLVVVVWYTI